MVFYCGLFFHYIRILQRGKGLLRNHIQVDLIRFLTVFLVCIGVGNNVYAEEDFPISIISSANDVVSFPHYFKYISSLKDKEVPSGQPVETRPAFETKALNQLNIFVGLLPYAARNTKGLSVDEDKINSHTIFMNAELRDIFAVYIDEINNRELDQLFQAAYYLEIKPLENIFAYFIARRIKQDRFVCDNHGDVVDLEGALVRNEFELSYSLVADLKDGPIDEYFRKHLKLLAIGLEEYSLEDYIGAYGQPSIVGGMLDLSNIHITSLQGINLISESGKVTCLSLRNNEILDFDIDPESPIHPFAMFGHLKALYLDHNRLVNLPSDLFKQLNHLSELDVSYNQIAQLPAGVFDCLDDLQILWLKGNQLSNLPKELFQKVQNMTELDLSDNQLVGLHVQLRGLKKLSRLDLSGNKIGDVTLGTFKGLCGLEVLCLHSNLLSELPKDLFLFQGLSHLKVLTLYGNALTHLPEGAFLGLGCLEQLDLHNNKLEELPVAVFNGLRKLAHLDLSGNRMSNDQVELLKYHVLRGV